MRLAQLVIELPQKERGTSDIPEFTVTVEIGAVKFDVRVDMGLVNVGGDYKLVLAPVNFIANS